MSTLVLQRSRDIPAPVAEVWALVSELDAYHHHVASLAETRVVAGSGQGARRRCVDVTGAAWEESCTVWEPRARVVVEVDVATYPAKLRALFTAVRGTWGVQPIAGGTRAWLSFELRLRPVPGLATVMGAFRGRFERQLDEILASYARSLGQAGDLTMR